MSEEYKLVMSMNWKFVRGFVLIIVMALCSIVPVKSETNEVAMVQQIEVLRKQIDKLRQENELLRKENKESEKQVVLTTEEDPEPTNDTGYWLSNTGVRHNKSCYFYKNTKGHSCWKHNGRACKICGG